jgi:3-hydroxybutyryl-CoA dehydrogenase
MHVAVLGAGTMGSGIAHVSALAEHSVSLRDIESGIVNNGLETIEVNLEEGVSCDKLTQSEKEEAIDRIEGTTDLEQAVSEARSRD